MIQLLGIRTYEEYGRMKPYVTLEKNKWRAPSVTELLLNYKTYLNSIPNEERFNIMFSLANVEDGSSRTFISQEIYPFDIDGIDVTRIEEYLDAVLPVLKLSRDNCTVVATGHGIHIYAQGKLFEDIDYFKSARPIYKLVCDACNRAIADKWLTGGMDTDMWSPARMGRLPDTLNRKDYKGLPDVNVTVLYNNIKPLDYELENLVQLEKVQVNDQVSPKALARLPKIDTEGVLEGCDYLKYCKENQESINEPQWYAMLSILGRLDNGSELCHAYSSEHPKYRPEDTEIKMQQALHTSGPRTCENIGTLWEGCKGCANFGKVRSPILLKGERFIATEVTGFRKIVIDKNGVPSPKDVNYDDLMMFYNREHPHITISETGEVYTFKDTHWRLTSRLDLQAFAEEHINPKPKSNERDEFVKKIQSNNIKPKEFLDCSGLMNLKNGVFDLTSLVLLPHSPEFGFRNIIPYEYDSTAKCPRFDQFLEEITMGDLGCAELLLEFAGYSMSNTPPEYGEKALILFGEGANGKSVFIDILRKLAGEGSSASITMADLSSETQRYQLVGKLFNVSEETPRKSIMESSMFKNIITGGVMTVKQLYHQPYSVKNECKLIFACNDLPIATDTSHGLFRRLLIVPFNAVFTGAKADKNLRMNMYAELSGVLNRVIEGYIRLRKNNWHFTLPEAVAKEAEDFEASTSPIISWFSDMLEIDKHGFQQSGDMLSAIYKAYRADVENTYGIRAVIEFGDFRKELRRYLRAAKGLNDWGSRLEYRTGFIKGVNVKGLRPSEVDSGTDF